MYFRKAFAFGKSSIPLVTCEGGDFGLYWNKSRPRRREHIGSREHRLSEDLKFELAILATVQGLFIRSSCAIPWAETYRFPRAWMRILCGRPKASCRKRFRECIAGCTCWIWRLRRRWCGMRLRRKPALKLPKRCCDILSGGANAQRCEPRQDGFDCNVSVSASAGSRGSGSSAAMGWTGRCRSRHLRLR